MRKESGEWKSRWRIRDLADRRSSQAVLDFLSATDVGRLVPAEEDAGHLSGSAGRQGAGRREEGGGGRARCRGRIGRRGGATAVPTPAPPHATRRRGLRDGTRFPLFFLVVRTLFFSFVISLVRCTSSWDRPGRRAEGRGELAARRLARTADGRPGQNVRRHSLDGLYASMIKQTKNTAISVRGNLNGPPIVIYITERTELMPSRHRPAVRG